MVKKFIIVDDLDLESEATATIKFAVDGQNYLLELSEHNAARFYADLAPWMTAAAKVSARSGQRKTEPAPEKNPEIPPRRRYGKNRRAWWEGPQHKELRNSIRDWAHENQVDGVSKYGMGRIAETLVRAYLESMGKSAEDFQKGKE
jgi:Lsr2